MSYTDKELQYIHELISENAKLTATNKLLMRVNEEFESKNKWISVKEKLPQTDNKHTRDYSVLVYIPEREGCNQYGIYIGKLCNVKGDDGTGNFWGIKTQSCDWTIWGWSYFEHPIVTHWKPLSSPPSEFDNTIKYEQV